MYEHMEWSSKTNHLSSLYEVKQDRERVALEQQHGVLSPQMSKLQAHIWGALQREQIRG